MTQSRAFRDGRRIIVHHTIVRAAAVLSAFVTILCTQAALAFRCPDGIVAIGDTKEEVVTKCGEPTFVDQRVNKLYVASPAGPMQLQETSVEEWFYNPGPKGLIRIFVFHNGKLVSMQTGGRGVDAADTTTTGRLPIVSTGDTKAQVLLKWGRPDETRQYRELVGNEGDEGAEEEVYVRNVVQEVLIEEWTYDFGTGRLVRIIVFANGRLIRNLTGGRSKSTSR